MSLPETILHSIELPNFIIKFKDTLVQQLLSPIDRTIQALKSASDPVLLLLLLILFIQMIRLAILQTATSKQQKTCSDPSQWHSLGKEIKDLKKQLKSLQKSLQQLKSSDISVGRANSQNRSGAGAQVSRMIQRYKATWRRRQQIAEHILDYQIKLIDVVKKIKKNSRIISTNQIVSNAKPRVKDTPANSTIQISEIVSQKLPQIQIQNSKSTRTHLDATKERPQQKKSNENFSKYDQEDYTFTTPLQTSATEYQTNLPVKAIESVQQYPQHAQLQRFQRQETAQLTCEELVESEIAPAPTSTSQAPVILGLPIRQLPQRPGRPAAGGKGQKRTPPPPPRRF